MNYVKNQIAEFEKAINLYNENNENSYVHIFEKYEKEVDRESFCFEGDVTAKTIINVLEPYNSDSFLVDVEITKDWDGWIDGFCFHVAEVMLDDDNDILSSYKEMFKFEYNQSTSFHDVLKEDKILESEDFNVLFKLVHEFELLQIPMLKKLQNNVMLYSDEILTLFQKKFELIDLIREKYQ